MTLAEYMRKVGRDMEMSQHELAKELNVSYTWVNRWENKQVSPGRLARKSIREFFGAQGIPIPIEMLEDNGHK